MLYFFFFIWKNSNKEKAVSATLCGNKPSGFAWRQNMYYKQETPHIFPRDAVVRSVRCCYNTASYWSVMSWSMSLYTLLTSYLKPIDRVFQCEEKGTLQGFVPKTSARCSEGRGEGKSAKLMHESNSSILESVHKIKISIYKKSSANVMTHRLS